MGLKVHALLQLFLSLWTVTSPWYISYGMPGTFSTHFPSLWLDALWFFQHPDWRTWSNPDAPYPQSPATGTEAQVSRYASSRYRVAFDLHLLQLCIDAKPGKYFKPEDHILSWNIICDIVQHTHSGFCFPCTHARTSIH
jgi:hypothetical protein